jgi:hypothetical protein
MGLVALAVYRPAIVHFMEDAMGATLRAALIGGFFLATCSLRAPAQTIPPPEQQQQAFTSGELVNAGQQFFGTVSRGLASLIERAVGQWGLPNGYVLGEEAGGAFFFRRPALRGRHALYQECRRSQGVLAGADARMGFRR